MRLVFAGTPGFAARHLRALLDAGFQVAAVFTQPDRPGKRGRAPMPSPVKRLACAAGLPVRQPAKLGLADLQGLEADVMVVVAYGQILEPSVLQRPRLGCVNVHASLLPRWRGAAPMQRALLAGDSMSGVTLVQMDAGLDTGDILDWREVAVAPGETCGSLEEKLAHLGTAMLTDALPRLERLARRPQPDQGACLAPKVVKAEAQLDWRKPASALERQVRAFNPAPGAYAFLDGLRLKIWEATPVDDAPSAPPGAIVSLDRQALTIACGEGCLAVTRLQLPKGKGLPMSAADLANAWARLFPPGALLA